MTRSIAPALRKRLARIRALVMDCDGVLTDGRLYYGEHGVALKAFDVKDGLGLVRLRDGGMRLGMISADSFPGVARRAERLGIAHVVQGTTDKAQAFREFATAHGLPLDAVAYMGDDLNDLGPMKLAGVALAPCDAAAEVRRAADWVAPRGGGRGAVRDAAELLLNCARRAGRA